MIFFVFYLGLTELKFAIFSFPPAVDILSSFMYTFLHIFLCISFSDGNFMVGLHWWHSNKELPASAGDAGFIPGSGRSPGEVNSNPLQYSCLKNPMDRGAWQATVHEVAESDTA